MSDAERWGDDPPPNAAAVARNWRSVLWADAAIGIAVVAVGIGVMAVSNLFAGAGVASLGAAYGMVVWRRYRLWAAWRQRQGLT